MKIKFTKHAIGRMKERGLNKNIVEEFIKSPDKIANSNINERRFLIKKIYYHKKYKKDHLLMMICEKEKDVLTVITIIDTSKISKYI